MPEFSPEGWLQIGAAMAALVAGFVQTYRVVSRLRRETLPNGSSRCPTESLRHVVDRIDRQLEAQQRSIERITDELLPGIEAQLAFQQTSLQLSGDIARRNVFWTDRDGQNLFVSRTYCRSLGYLKEDLIGLKWQQALHPEDQARFLARFSESLRVCGRIEVTVRFIRADGAIIPALVRCEPVALKGVFHGMAGDWEHLGAG